VAWAAMMLPLGIGASAAQAATIAHSDASASHRNRCTWNEAADSTLYVAAGIACGDCDQTLQGSVTPGEAPPFQPRFSGHGLTPGHRLTLRAGPPGPASSAVRGGWS
jgi:hypothetical protein